MTEQYRGSPVFGTRRIPSDEAHPHVADIAGDSASSVRRPGAEDRRTTLDVADIAIEYVTKAGNTILACTDINLQVAPGEFVSIIGPSGCGKSSLLHCMGGMLKPSSGIARFGEETVTRPDPHYAAYVFQDYSLFPWKTVLGNITVALRFAGSSRTEATRRARSALTFVGLDRFADSFPRELSGGMQQRVAVARALAMEPRFLLMDEPFGALDEQTRGRLGTELVRLLSGSGQGVVMITHSLDEAIVWADRVVVMSRSPGRIIEEVLIDAPRPRERSFLASTEFQKHRVHLFELLEQQEVASDETVE